MGTTSCPEASVNYKQCFGSADAVEQLSRPKLVDGAPVTGKNKKKWKVETKRKRNEMKQAQEKQPEFWSRQKGDVPTPPMRRAPAEHRGGMCPSNMALNHPAGPTLQEYATTGCPVEAGRQWTREEIELAIEQGPHDMDESAAAQFAAEAIDKEKKGLVRIVPWSELKNMPDHLFPKELKVSPIFAVTHKSRKWRAILDLAFTLRVFEREVQAVNDSSTKTAPRRAIDQIGSVLQRIVYCMATAPEGKKIYAAKWDVKDGFWRMSCEKGAEWNFAYVLPQEDGKPPKLVIPTSLQMGWLESPPYFGAASETARDVGEVYAQTAVGSLPRHKFEPYTKTKEEYKQLPQDAPTNDDFLFNLEVYVDDFIGLAVAESKAQLDHISRAAMHGLHDVSPPTMTTKKTQTLSRSCAAVTARGPW